MADLTILGSVNLDVVLRVASLPRPGETVSATGSDHYLGGKGANQAVAAARSGGNLEFHACLGDDEDGAWLKPILGHPPRARLALRVVTTSLLVCRPSGIGNRKKVAVVFG